jgi:hypothetical protein
MPRDHGAMLGALPIDASRIAKVHHHCGFPAGWSTGLCRDKNVIYFAAIALPWFRMGRTPQPQVEKPLVRFELHRDKLLVEPTGV